MQQVLMRHHCSASLGLPGESFVELSLALVGISLVARHSLSGHPVSHLNPDGLSQNGYGACRADHKMPALSGCEDTCQQGS
eukprot:6166094-Pyramimonas_sp.AAC.1